MKGLTKEKHYILGCSGGPDSMALCHMLLKNNIKFDVAFVNYYKRPESVIEEKAVKEFCNKNNIRCHILSALNKNVKGNFQAWARDFRYNFFYALVKENNYDGIIIAHHLDDLLETYIFQIKRGGIYSYFGLNEKTMYKDVEVIRPLLNRRKKSLQQYCIRNKVPYFIDSSNLKNDYTRNAIRHNLVEKLDSEEVKKLLLEIKEKNKINKIEIKESEKFVKRKEKSLNEFLNLKKDVQRRVIYSLLTPYKKINGREIDAVIEFLHSKNNGELKIKENLFIFKDYGKFEIDKKEGNYSYLIDKESILDNDLLYIDLILGSKELFVKEDYYPLTVCNVKKEETVKIGNLIKKVNRLFIDEKIPNHLRSKWPCIKDKNGKIIYFPRKKEEKINNNIIFKFKL